MRDLYKTLKLFDIDGPMDYCQEFDEIKSILEYCHNHVVPFNKLRFRGGNEATINELVQRLQEMLLNRELVSADTKKPLGKAYPVLRKVLMFLIMNTDAIYKYNLKEDPSYVHVVEICPLLPKFLLMALIWELKLDIFFYEALAHTPCWFSLQYFNAAADSLKYVEDPYEVIEKVHQLVRAICLSIVRSDKHQINEVERKVTMAKLAECAMNLLRQFYTPDAEKFKNFKQKQHFRYSGYVLKHLFEMVLHAFDLYESPQKAIPTIDARLYGICENICRKFQGEALMVLPSVKEQQLQLIRALLNSLQYNVMLVKVDMFMYWVEVDLSPTKNLQMAIGSLAYTTIERMKANSVFAHDIITQLVNVAVRPKTLEETIREATLGDILNSLDESLAYEVKKQWVDELFNRTIALGNDECIEALKKNIKLVTVENCKQILDYIKLEVMRNQAELAGGGAESNDSVPMDMDPSDFGELSALIALALVNFDVTMIKQLIEYQTKLFGKSASYYCQTSDFNQRAIFYLNKSSTGNYDVQEFLALCFENAEEMWFNVFGHACNSSKRFHGYYELLRNTRPLGDHYVEECLKKAICEDTNTKYSPEMLCEIYFLLFHDSRKEFFFKDLLMDKVRMMLDTRAFSQLLPIIKSLSLIAMHGHTQNFKPLHFGDSTAPLFIMLGRIMDKCRWSLLTFSTERAEVLNECIKFVTVVSSIFLPVAKEMDRQWITDQAKKLFKPMTQFYFQKYSLKPEQNHLMFDVFLRAFEPEESFDEKSFLIKYFLRCTKKEAEWLVGAECLTPHIHEAMIAFGSLVNQQEKENAINVYRYCLVNYLDVVKNLLIPLVVNDGPKSENLAMDILKVIKSAPNLAYKDSFLSAEPLLQDILVRAKPADDTMDAVRKFLDTMDDCLGKDAFVKNL